MSEPLDASMTDGRTCDLLWLPIDRLYPMLTVNKSSRVRKYFQFAFNSPTFHLELTRLCENLLFPRTTLSSLASAASFSGERRQPRAKGKVFHRSSRASCAGCLGSRVWQIWFHLLLRTLSLGTSQKYFLAHCRHDRWHRIGCTAVCVFFSPLVTSPSFSVRWHVSLR